MTRLLAIFLLASSVLLCSRGLAQDMPVSVEVQYSLFVRILTFDRALQDEGIKKIVVGVLYQDGVRVSIQTKDEFLEAAAQSNVKQIFGKPIECISISANDSTLQERMRRKGIVILYVTPFRAFDVRSLADKMSDEKILTITGVPEYVRDGIAIGVGTRADNPIILINLREAKRQGADLSAQLLRLATIIN